MKINNIQIYYTGWIVSVGNKKNIFFHFFLFPVRSNWGTGVSLSVEGLAGRDGGSKMIRM